MASLQHWKCSSDCAANTYSNNSIMSPILSDIMIYRQFMKSGEAIICFFPKLLKLSNLYTRSEYSRLSDK